MRFICGCLLIAVPRFACHQPRLEAELATAAPAAAAAAAALPGSMQGKPRVHAVHLRLPTDCCASFCVPSAPPGSRAGHCSTATMTGSSCSSSSSIAGVDAR
ncbi:hypothetical protein PF003_g27983 [Phytophthora fragariae]|nr:hypothetical protein PF003_g27983 [Phytophthora fragariae]